MNVSVDGFARAGVCMDRPMCAHSHISFMGGVCNLLSRVEKESDFVEIVIFPSFLVIVYTNTNTNSNTVLYMSIFRYGLFCIILIG